MSKLLKIKVIKGTNLDNQKNTNNSAKSDPKTCTHGLFLISTQSDKNKITRLQFYASK